MDYAYLVLSRWDQGHGRIAELSVFGPSGLQSMTERLFGEEGAFAADLDARTGHPGSHFIYEMRGGVLPRERPSPTVTEISSDAVLERGDWRVRTAAAVHCQPQLESLAYRLEAGGKAIVFTGDTAPTESLTRLAEGADVLVHMCHFVNGVVTDPRLTTCCSGHLDAARTAKEANVRTLVLSHVTEQVEQPGVREQVVAEASDIYGGNIVFGEDLLDVPVGDVGVSKIQ